MKKRKTVTVAACIFCVLLLASCQKDDNSQTTESIEGTETFLSEERAMLAEEEAVQIAVNHSKVKDTENVVLQTPVLEQENGVTCYEIKFTVEQKEYEYNIEAFTGEIISFDYENGMLPDAADKTPITIEDAKETALNWAVVGSLDCVFTREEYREEETPPVYVIEFLYEGREYEFEILSDGTVAECSMEQADVRQAEPGRVEK